MLAYALIIVSVLAFAVFPLVIASLPPGQIPTPVFLLTLSIIGAIALILSSLVLLLRMQRAGAGLKLRSAFHLSLRGDALRLGMVNAVLNNMGYGFLYLAIQSGLVLTGAVLYELWSSVFLLASWLLRKEKQGAFVARQGGPTTLIFFVVGIIGLLILAYAGALPNHSNSGAVQARDWFGLTLAVLSPIAMGLSFVFGTENGQRIARRLQREADLGEQEARIVGGMISSMLLRLFTMAIQAVLLLILLQIGYIKLPDAQTVSEIWPVLLAAGLLVAVGGSFSTIGNTLSSKANLNLLYYFVPFLTLIALYATDIIPSIAPLAFYGCILVLAANYVLTASYRHSLAFRCAIGGVCLSATLVLHTSGIGLPLRVELVAVLLGLFGILAAFLIDRMARDGDRLFGGHSDDRSVMTTQRSQALESYGQNLFVLWTLAFGSLALLFLFRTGQDKMYDFFAVVTAVAVIYMSLVPVDLMGRFSSLWQKQQANRETLEYEQFVFSLLVSVLFLFALLSLLLLALQVR